MKNAVIIEGINQIVAKNFEVIKVLGESWNSMAFHTNEGTLEYSITKEGNVKVVTHFKLDNEGYNITKHYDVVSIDGVEELLHKVMMETYFSEEI